MTDSLVKKLTFFKAIGCGLFSPLEAVDVTSVNGTRMKNKDNLYCSKAGF